MATITAAAGGGNWTTGATWVGGSAPGAGDDALLTVTSGNVTIDTGAVARSLNCTGYVGTLTHTAGVTLTLGDGTAGLGTVALTMVAGMTYTLGNAATSAITFVSTSATQQTITTGGKTLGNTTINGAGSSYVLADATTIGATATMTLTAGTFATGGFACSWGLFAITGASAKTLTLGSSVITITGSNSNSVLYSGSNCTFTANTAVITFSGVASGLNGGIWNGTSLVTTAAVQFFSLSNNLTVANVTVTGAAFKTGTTVTISAASIITGTLTVNGNSTVNRAIVLSSVIGSARTVTAAAVSFSNVDFMDIVAAGAAVPWTGTSMGNALGNTNITFDTPVTQTHTASAGGNWSDATKWTSRVPLPQDNVVVDVNTTGTLTADMPRLGADVSFAGFAATLNATVAGTMYGSIVLGGGMTYTGAVGLTLSARSAKTITSNAKQFPNSLTITAPSGTYTLVDALNVMTLLSVTSSSTFSTSASNFAISAASLTTSTTGGFPTLNLGTSTVTLTSITATVLTVNSQNVIFNGSLATVVLSGVSATNKQVFLQGNTLGTLTYTVAGSTGALEVDPGLTGTAKVTALNFSDASNARSLLFTAGRTFTVTNFNVFGTPGKLMTIDSVGGAATHTLSKASGTVSSDYLSIAHSIATGGAYWYAGANSFNGGNNTGWIFTAPPTAGTLSNFFFMFAGQN